MIELAQAAANPAYFVEIHPEYIGYLSRNDGWEHPAWEREDGWSVLFLIERGEIRFGSGEHAGTVTPGDALFVGSEVKPRIAFSAPIEYREVRMRFRNPPAALKRWALLRETLRFRAPVEAASLIDHLTVEQSTLAEGDSSPLLGFRLSLLLALCDAEVKRYKEANRKLSPVQRIRLVNWVRQNLGCRPSPARVARELGLSPDYFSRIFRNTFGQPPRDWLIRERILAARRMLDEGVLSTTEVMQSCGFDNAAHFSRQMKRLTGRTPGGSRGWVAHRG
jgi:AraC-like DNA-binding protein